MQKKILVVDDDEMVRIALEELLLSKGYRPVVAPGGQEALEQLEKGGFDLVVLDVIMPGMDGYEVCRKIREEQKWSKLPVIMLTALSSEKEREKGQAAGADMFLPKPISPQKLLSLIETAMG
jgi:two-component system cell cycle response regulator